MAIDVVGREHTGDLVATSGIPPGVPRVVAPSLAALITTLDATAGDGL